jgi:hypothetical protein
MNADAYIRKEVLVEFRCPSILTDDNISAVMFLKIY